MIKVDNGLVTVKGNNEEIMNDLSSVCGYLRDCLRKDFNEDISQEKIMLAVERGFLISENMTHKTALDMQKLTKRINGR